MHVEMARVLLRSCAFDCMITGTIYYLCFT